jgi:hypothetical protein
MSEGPRVTVDEATQAALSGAIRAMEERNSDLDRSGSEGPRVTVNELTQAALSGAIRALEERNSDRGMFPALTLGIVVNLQEWDGPQSTEHPPPHAPEG